MQRFLISRLSALGDTVCSLPVATALKRAFPESHITWVVDPRFAGIVECCTAVDEVMAFKPGFRKIPTYPEKFDAAIDLQGLLKSGICLLKAKADRKVGYHWRREAAWLFSERVVPDPSSWHVVDQYVDVARFLGAEAHRAEFSLVPREEDVLAVRRKLKERSVVGRIMVVNAGAGWATKRWPPAHFARVIDAVEALGVRAVLVGGPGAADRAAADEVKQACTSSPADLLGHTNVRELVALIRLASVHLGGDTGSTHIAAALDVPAVGLYSITNPRRSCPYGQVERCHYEPSGLANIQPDSVFDTIRDIL